MYNLLEDPIIRIDLVDGSRRLVTLPEAFAALMSDEVLAFPACRAHHRHAWHAFLSQLGAIAVYEASLSGPPSSAGAWKYILRALTRNYPSDEPWTLAVDDITVPAFMQPPTSKPSGVADYRADELVSPEQLDLIITTKNHDHKGSIAIDAKPDDWAVTLVTLQTMEGYRGRGYYGISRMNAGFASRPAFSLAPTSTRPGPHLRRDIEALLEARPQLLEDYPMVDGGVHLLWTVPWDGEEKEFLPLEDLDPLYIEVCRRVRLRRHSRQGQIRAVRAATEDCRLNAKALKGVVGDPWTPVKRGQDGGALTISLHGFGYRQITDILSEWEYPPLLNLTRAETERPAPMRLVARGMARGRGTSSGYHERSIPLSLEATQELAEGTGAGDLGAASRARVDLIASVQGIIHHAINVYRVKNQPRGGTTSASDPLDQVRPWRSALNDVVDSTFFDDLQEEIAADPSQRPDVRRRWLLRVIEEARQILHFHLDVLPCPSGRQFRSAANAVSLFESRVRSKDDLRGVLHGAPDVVETQQAEVNTQQTEEATVTEDRTADEAAAVTEGETADEVADRPRTLPDVAVSIAGEMAHEHYPTGDLALLRRMDPARPGPSAFWQLLAKRDLILNSNLEAKWGLIIHGIALMTPRNIEGEEFRSAHDGYTSVGKALYCGNANAPPNAFYSEVRLERLMRAEGPALYDHVARVCRMMKSAGVRFNWRELARYILAQNHDPDAVAESRRRILREYYRAQWLSTPKKEGAAKEGQD